MTAAIANRIRNIIDADRAVWQYSRRMALRIQAAKASAAQDSNEGAKIQMDIRVARNLSVEAFEICHNASFDVNPSHPDLSTTEGWLILAHLALCDRAATDQVAERFGLDVEAKAAWVDAQRQEAVE